ncbi:hypothetical protein MA16_Dca015750 [Dendrobium catenatum]|uniref:Uncharacterized protein n=1 Tax=Dendrobium catenatum TaxID=906689 RepID=A0A2I0WHV0_9ASPA|nr:hypothetical protein MA16_Dca015750 [Dendrobium catenatum]
MDSKERTLGTPTLEELDDFDETFGTYTLDDDFSYFLQVSCPPSSSDPLIFVYT